MQWQLNIYGEIVKFVMKSRDFDEFIIDVLAQYVLAFVVLK